MGTFDNFFGFSGLVTQSNQSAFAQLAAMQGQPQQAWGALGSADAAAVRHELERYQRDYERTAMATGSLRSHIGLEEVVQKPPPKTFRETLRAEIEAWLPKLQ